MTLMNDGFDKQGLCDECQRTRQEGHVQACADNPLNEFTLDERNAEHEPDFYLRVNQAQATEIACGQVPLEVREMARTLVDWSLETVGQKTRPRRR